MVGPLLELAGSDERVLVGPGTSDDAGVYLLDAHALVVTADFITPVCDDAQRFGRIAAANALSDVYAMGGQPILALNLCCFPDDKVPDGVLADILLGGVKTMQEAGAALLGGHTVRDKELKFGLAVVGIADPDHILTNATAAAGDRLILTKPLGTGVLINAFKARKLDESALEPALKQMERLNSTASSLALKHGARAATDITGFGFAGHSLEIARASNVRLQVRFASLPVFEGFYDMVKRGVGTGATEDNIRHAESMLEGAAGLDGPQMQLLHDPQTSGGLLLVVPAESASALTSDLVDTGHDAADIGEVLGGPPCLEII